jgi:SAM-dependent methyltransferase
VNDPTLQDRAERLREGPFLGVPIDDFERAGREQLIYLLMHGLTPNSTVVDIGCGVLRAGYWLIHLLDAGHYFGIEPSVDRLTIGTTLIVEPAVIAAKQPRFDNNENFDTSVFGRKFDFFLAYSIWTHAPKPQISTMLDNFLRDSHEDSVFLTTFLPAGRGGADYNGDAWVGTSHRSQSAGCIFHRFSWIEEQCRERGLSVECIGRDSTHTQTWLRIARAHRPPRIRDITFLPPSLELFARLLIRRLKRAMRLTDHTAENSRS